MYSGRINLQWNLKVNIVLLKQELGNAFGTCRSSVKFTFKNSQQDKNTFSKGEKSYNCKLIEIMNIKNKQTNKKKTQRQGCRNMFQILHVISKPGQAWTFLFNVFWGL